MGHWRWDSSVQNKRKYLTILPLENTQEPGMGLGLGLVRRMQKATGLAYGNTFNTRQKAAVLAHLKSPWPKQYNRGVTTHRSYCKRRKKNWLIAMLCIDEKKIT